MVEEFKEDVKLSNLEMPILSVGDTSADITMREGLSDKNISHTADTPKYTPPQQATTKPVIKGKGGEKLAPLTKLGTGATNVGKAVIQSDKRSISPFSWTGSCFQLLLLDLKLYALLLLFVIGLILRYSGAVEPVPFAETLRGTMDYVSFALTFVLTFYLNTSYDRFMVQGQLARALVSSISTIVMLVRLDMKNDVDLQLTLARLVNAGHFLTWCDMAKVYPWRYFTSRGLLTQPEVDILKSFSTANKDALVSAWMLEKIANWQIKKIEGGFLSMHDVLGLKSQVLEIRKNSAALKKIRSVKTPFLYTHLLWWTLMTFLTINVYYAALGESEPDNPENATDEEVWWKIGIIIIIIIFLSLFNIALALQEPFGTSPGDIKLNEILEGTIARTRSILSVHLNPDECVHGFNMDEAVFTAACAEDNEVRCGKTPHTWFLTEALPRTVDTMHIPYQIPELADEFGLPFKVMMDHGSELQESLFSFLKNTEVSNVEDQTKILPH